MFEHNKRRVEKGQLDRQIVSSIQTYINEHGYAPTIREIAANVGRSLETVHRRLADLKDQGVVTQDGTKARTLRVKEETTCI